jgi:hypothetical protein
MKPGQPSVEKGLGRVVKYSAPEDQSDAPS